MREGQVVHEFSQDEAEPERVMRVLAGGPVRGNIA
jgi:hypothetical protein